MSEPTTAAGQALTTWGVEVEAMLAPHLPQNGMGQKIRANVLAIEAEAQAPLAAIVALAERRIRDLESVLRFHNQNADGDTIPCLPHCIACDALVSSGVVA